MGQHERHPQRNRSPLPPRGAAEWIIHRLRDAGHQALLAGGCVRDMLMGREPKDYDVATDARPDVLLKLFRRTLKVGVQFGVVIVGDAGPWIEVATFRSDVTYSDGRHPDRVIFSTAEQDALRRDFTVNGLFLDPIEDRVIDYVQGRRDIDRRLIRAIGRPRERFAEDHLRLLRAARFAAVLEFNIEEQTWHAILEQAPLLATVSRERVLDELERMLTSPGRAVGLRLLAESGLLAYAIPVAGIGTPWQAARVELACARLAALPRHADLSLALAAALADWPPDRIDHLCRQMTCSNELRKAVVWLVESLPVAYRAPDLTLADLKRLLWSDSHANLERLLRADLAATQQPLQPWRTLVERAAAIPRERVRPAPLVGGEVLQAMNIAPGPIYRRVLDAVYTAQLNEQLADRDAALALLRQQLRQAGYEV